MRNRPPVAFLAAALVLAAAWPAHAKQPNRASEALRIVPDESESFSLTAEGRVSDRTGFPAALYRVAHTVRPDTPEAMARQYLAEAAARLGLKADLSDLEYRTFRDGQATTVVRFAQTCKGVPVYNADLAVTLNRRHEVIFVMNGYKQVTLADVTPRISATAARTAALGHLRAQGPLNYDRTDLVVYPGQAGARLAYRVTVEPRTGPYGTWESLVDARTGEVFRVEDLSCWGSVNGTGTVFDPDPLSSGQQNYGGAWADNGDADNVELNGQRFTRSLLGIDQNGATFTLAGPRASIIDIENPFNGLWSQNSADFSSTRFPDKFEAANTYYHIDTFMRYINDPPPAGLGITLMPFQYSGGVQFDPQGLDGVDNSHYLPGSGQLAFGEGDVDDDEDADVIIHELGHGLHHWLQGGGGPSQVQGLSEGTGDYFAASYSRSFNQWPSNTPQFNWVFSWDGHGSDTWPGRVTNWPNHYPDQLTGQIHTDGQIWSTVNMRIWNQLGRRKTDAAVIEGLNMTTGSTNQQDAAQAVLNAAGALGYSLAERTIMLNEYTTTGYTVVLPVELMSVTVE